MPGWCLLLSKTVSFSAQVCKFFFRKRGRRSKYQAVLNDSWCRPLTAVDELCQYQSHKSYWGDQKQLNSPQSDCMALLGLPLNALRRHCYLFSGRHIWRPQGKRAWIDKKEIFPHKNRLPRSISMSLSAPSPSLSSHHSSWLPIGSASCILGLPKLSLNRYPERTNKVTMVVRD